jgi:hypothetical protein
MIRWKKMLKMKNARNHKPDWWEHINCQIITPLLSKNRILEVNYSSPLLMYLCSLSNIVKRGINFLRIFGVHVWIHAFCAEYWIISVVNDDKSLMVAYFVNYGIPFTIENSNILVAQHSNLIEGKFIMMKMIPLVHKCYLIEEKFIRIQNVKNWIFFQFQVYGSIQWLLSISKAFNFNSN